MSIIAWLSQSWFGELIMIAVNWWKKKEAEVQRAGQQYSDDLQAHADDGSKSVDLRDSYEAQMTKLQKELDEANGKEIIPPKA